MTRFLAVGDVGPDAPDADALFVNVADAIRAADLAFCQLEITLTERGQRVPQVRHTSRNHPRTAEAIKRAGFQLVSWASNHALDWGTEGFLDTIEALESAGLTPLGVGRDLEAARAVKVTEVDGVRVAVLAYCSILPMDYWATSRRPGVAPMRALTAYEPTEPDQPGTPSKAWT
ncbi:MAG: CapA family protein, partial [Chloroflexota bacterium]|nr:CapA family protein [Chloroflexota bacterium]